MMVQVGNRQEPIDKEEIINYEYRMIELSLPLVEPIISNTAKYVPWELETKIRELVGAAAHTVRWVGCSQTAYLETYAYIMLMGTGQCEANILEFKYTVYKLGKKCLQLAEQKLLVEFLCLIEYSRDKYSFLNKYPQIEAIFIKILQYLQEEHSSSEDSVIENTRKAKIRRKYPQPQPSNPSSPNSNSVSQQLEYQRELEQIYRSFSSYFHFISLMGSNEFSCTFRLFGNKDIYLVIEKDCYFMVEPSESTSQETNHHLSTGIKQQKEQGQQDQQQPIFFADSSNVNFDKSEFLDILNYKSEVQESKVIPVERGSQIRKPTLPDTLTYLNTPNFLSAVPQPFLSPNQLETQRNEDKGEHERTFIDDLLINVVEVEVQKGGKRKKAVTQKMKNILMIKEQLKKVQIRIQSKIKLMDEAKAYQPPPDINVRHHPLKPTSEKQDTSKEKVSQKQFKTNIVKQSVVRKHAAIFLKKERKTSYNSVKIIPYRHHLYKPEDSADVETPSSATKRGEAKPTLTRVQRMLSQKGISRPHSSLKMMVDDESKRYQRSRNPLLNMKKEYKVHSVSPKNVNVNVNVNINQNMLAHAPSFPIRHKEPYINNNPQYYASPNHKQYEAKHKQPHFLERVKSKHNNNPEASFTKSGKIIVTLNK